jgi:hypothetical protein
MQTSRQTYIIIESATELNSVLSPEFYEPIRLDHFFGQKCVVIVRVGTHRSGTHCPMDIRSLRRSIPVKNKRVM